MQSWVQGPRGGYLTSVELSRQVRVAAQNMQRFRQFVRPEAEFGRNMGDTLQFNKVSNLEGSGRVIGETETVPTTQLTIYKDTVTAKEYTLGVDFTWTLEILAKLDIREIVINALKDDMAKTLDKAAADQFKATDLVYTPTGTDLNKTSTLGTTGTPVTATRNIAAWDIKNIVDEMRSTYRMPYYDGRDYTAVATTTFLRGLKDDTEYVESVKYGDPDRFFSGECGRYYGTRFVEESNALNGNRAGGLGEAVFFGQDPVVEIAVYPEEIQAKVGTDFGRDGALRWVWVGGFKRTWDFSSEGEARAVFVTSLT